MPKPKAVTPKVVLNLWLEPELRTRLDLTLFSELEGRVPHGEYSRFFTNLLREFFEWGQLDLTPYGYPSGYFVKGPKEMLKMLRFHLELKTEEVE